MTIANLLYAYIQMNTTEKQVTFWAGSSL